MIALSIPHILTDRTATAYLQQDEIAPWLGFFVLAAGRSGGKTRSAVVAWVDNVFFSLSKLVLESGCSLAYNKIYRLRTETKGPKMKMCIFKRVCINMCSYLFINMFKYIYVCLLDF